MEQIAQLAPVVFVLALLGGALWFLRAKASGGFALGVKASSGKLETIDRLGLTPQHSIYLVRLKDQALLLSVHPAGCNLLHSMPWTENDAGRRAS